MHDGFVVGYLSDFVLLSCRLYGLSVVVYDISLLCDFDFDY